MRLLSVRQRFSAAATEDAVALVLSAVKSGANSTLSMSRLEAALAAATPPLALLRGAGRAGGIKAVDKGSGRGVFLKLAVDAEDLYGTGMMASKVAKHEVAALDHFLGLDMPNLSGPLASCVDVAVPGSGTLRVQAFSLLPETKLCMGSQDAGETVHVSASLVGPMAAVAEAFWIAPTLIRPASGVVTERFGDERPLLPTALPPGTLGPVEPVALPAAPTGVASRRSRRAASRAVVASPQPAEPSSDAGSDTPVEASAASPSSGALARIQTSTGPADGRRGLPPFETRSANATSPAASAARDAAAEHALGAGAAGYDTMLITDGAGAQAAASGPGPAPAEAAPEDAYTAEGSVDQLAYAATGSVGEVGSGTASSAGPYAESLPLGLSPPVAYSEPWVGDLPGGAAGPAYKPGVSVDGHGHFAYMSAHDTDEGDDDVALPPTPDQAGISLAAAAARDRDPPTAGSIAHATSAAAVVAGSQHRRIGQSSHSDAGPRLLPRGSTASARVTGADVPATPSACPSEGPGLGPTASSVFGPALSTQATGSPGLGYQLSSTGTSLASAGSASRRPCDHAYGVAATPAPPSRMRISVDAAAAESGAGNQPAAVAQQLPARPLPLPSAAAAAAAAHPLPGTASQTDEETMKAQAEAQEEEEEDTSLSRWVAAGEVAEESLEPVVFAPSRTSVVSRPVPGARVVPGVSLPLPFDVEGHVAVTGERFLLDAHRLLLPDLAAITSLKQTLPVLATAVVRSTDSDGSEEWSVCHLGRSVVPHADADALRRHHNIAGHGAMRGMTGVQCWRALWTATARKAAEAALASTPDRRIAGFKGRPLRVAAFVPDAGFVVLATQAHPPLPHNKEAAILVASPGLFWGRTHALTLLLPPSAGPAIRRIGGPRICADALFRAYGGSADQRAALLQDAMTASGMLCSPEQLRGAASEALEGAHGMEGPLREGGGGRVGGGVFSRQRGWERDSARRREVKSALHARGLGLRHVGRVWSAWVSAQLERAPAELPVATVRGFAASCLPSTGSVSACALSDGARAVAEAVGLPWAVARGSIASTAVPALAAAALARAFASKLGKLPVTDLLEALTLSRDGSCRHLPCTAHGSASTVAGWSPQTPLPPLSRSLDGVADLPLALSWGRAQAMGTPLAKGRPVPRLKGGGGEVGFAAARQGLRGAVLQVEAVSIRDLDDEVERALKERARAKAEYEQRHPEAANAFGGGAIYAGEAGHAGGAAGGVPHGGGGQEGDGGGGLAVQGGGHAGAEAGAAGALDDAAAWGAAAVGEAAGADAAGGAAAAQEEFVWINRGPAATLARHFHREVIRQAALMPGAAAAMDAGAGAGAAADADDDGAGAEAEDDAGAAEGGEEEGEEVQADGEEEEEDAGVALAAAARLREELRHRQAHALDALAGEAPLLDGLALLAGRRALDVGMGEQAMRRAVALAVSAAVRAVTEHGAVKGFTPSPDPAVAGLAAGAKAAAETSGGAPHVAARPSTRAERVKARAAKARAAAASFSEDVAAAEAKPAATTLATTRDLLPQDEADRPTIHAAMEAARAAGGRFAEAVAERLAAMGRWLFTVGRRVAAEVWLAAAHDTAEAVGSRGLAVAVAVSLAACLARRGRARPAVAVAAHAAARCAAAVSELTGAAFVRGQPAGGELPLRKAMARSAGSPDCFALLVPALVADAQWAPTEEWRSGLPLCAGEAMTRAGRPDAALVPLQAAVDAAGGMKSTAPAAVEAKEALGVAMTSAGKAEAALKLLRGCLATRKATVGEGHEAFAGAALKLGRLYAQSGDHDKAIRLMIRSARIMHRRFGDESPAFAEALTEACVSFHALGRSLEAIDLLRIARAIQEETVGRLDPTTVRTLLQQGLCRVARNHRVIASELVESALTRLQEAEKESGDCDDSLLAEAWNAMGMVLGRANRQEDSKRAFLHSREVQARMGLQAPHPLMATSLGGLGRAMVRLGDLLGGAMCLKACCDMQRQVLGTGATALASSLSELCDALRKGARWREAALAIRECEVIRRRKLGRDHPATVGARLRLEGLRDFVGGVLPGEGGPLEEWQCAPPVPGTAAEAQDAEMQVRLAQEGQLHSEEGGPEHGRPLRRVRNRR